MKQMKNIKTPAYELKLGKGFFAGARWQCIKCGKQCELSGPPSSNWMGRCPDTASGNHVWQQF